MSDNPFSEPEDGDRTVVRPGSAGEPVRPSARAGPEAPAPVPSTPPLPYPQQPTHLAGEAEALPKVGLSPLAAAAAPILDLLARMSTGPQALHVGNPEELRQRCIRSLQVFEAEGRATHASQDELRAAHYSLCASLDDVALSLPWGYGSTWAQRSLISSLHHEVRSGERFFDNLSAMQKDPGRYRQALEICYLCLSLGMQGRYRLDSRGPAELDRIREGLYQLLTQLRGGWERELSPNWRGVDAPHRGPGRSVPAWVAGAIAAAFLGFGYVAVSRQVNAAGDDLQQRLADLRPGRLPTIERSAPPVDVPRVTSRPGQPEPVDRVRGFLQPEILAGLVEVTGDAQRVLVRIKGRGMFPSGSADVDPRFLGLLKRIGEALRDEPGQVTVAGHTDSQPVRTVKFPSNFHLSAARAEIAKRIIAAATGDPSRFSSLGRADTDPVGSNATPEGREANRRIDITLLSPLRKVPS